MPVVLDVYELISRLNKSEKSYFKKSAFKTKSKQQQELFVFFDLIDREVSKTNASLLDIDEVVKKKANASVVKHFSRNKNYLFNLITNTLNNLQKDKQPENLIWENYQKSKLLNEKGLINQALSLLKSTLQLANKLELFHLYKLVSSRYVEYLIVHVNKERLSMLRKEIDYLKVHDELESAYDFWVIHSFEMAHILHTTPRNAHKEAIEKFCKDLELPQDFDSPNVQMVWRRFLNVKLLGTQKVQERLDNLAHLVELFVNNPDLGKTNERYWMTTNFAYLDQLIRVKNFKDFKTTFNTTKDIELNNYTLNAQWSFLKELVMLYYMVGTSNFEKLKQTELNIEKVMAKASKAQNTNDIENAYFLLAACHFMIDDYDGLYKWHGQMDQLNTKITHIFHFSVRLMLLTKNYDYENVELTDSLIRSIKRFKKEKGLNLQIFDLFVSMIEKLSNTDSSQRNAIMQDCKNKMETLSKKDAIEQYCLSCFNTIAWVEAKLTGQPLQNFFG